MKSCGLYYSIVSLGTIPRGPNSEEVDGELGGCGVEGGDLGSDGRSEFDGSSAVRDGIWTSEMKSALIKACVNISSANELLSCKFLTVGKTRATSADATTTEATLVVAIALSLAVARPYGMVYGLVR